MLKLFLKHSAIYYIPTLVSRGLSIILLPLYTRVLSPADYGSLDLLTIFSSIVNLVIALEVSQGVARFYSSEEDINKKVLYASSAFWFTFICYLLFAILMLLFSSSFSTFIMGQPGMKLSFQIGVGYIFFNGIFYLIQNQLRFELRSSQNVIISLVMIIVTTAVSIWLTIILNLGLVGLLIGMISGVAVATILGLWWLKNSFCFCFSFKQLIEMLHFSAPLVVSGISVWLIMYVDRLMINHFLSIEAVGLYGIGYRLSLISLLLISGIQSSLTPLIYKYYKQVDTPKHLDQIFRLVVFFSLLIFIFLSLFSLDILKIMTTPEYYEASTVVVFLVPSFFLYSLYEFAPGLSIAKKTHLIILINVLGGFLNILLNYYFIQLFGFVGAAIATLISNACIFSSKMLVSQLFYQIPYKWNKILMSTILAFLFVLLFKLISLPDITRWLINILAIILFTLIVLKINLVNYKEIKNILGLQR